MSPCETDGEWAVLIENRPKGSTVLEEEKLTLQAAVYLDVWLLLKTSYTYTVFLDYFFFISHSVFIPPVSGLFPGLSRVSLPEGLPLGEWIR